MNWTEYLKSPANPCNASANLSFYYTLVVSGETNFEVQVRAQQLLDIIANFAEFADTELTCATLDQSALKADG